MSQIHHVPLYARVHASTIKSGKMHNNISVGRPWYDQAEKTLITTLFCLKVSSLFELAIHCACSYINPTVTPY